MTIVPLSALGRLNVHARVRSGWSTESRAIYAYKTLVTATLVADGVATLRFVEWRGECDRCDKGRFRDWNWGESYTVPCRDCNGTGKKTLRFTEARLPDGQIWHHPWEGRTNPGLDIARVAGVSYRNDADSWCTLGGVPLVWNDAETWRPKLPAERLPVAELVTLLNEVEDWVEAAKPPPGGIWLFESARRCLHQTTYRRVISLHPEHAYQLDLGRAPGGCFVCGDETELAGSSYGRMTPLLHWSLPVCKRHSEGPEKAEHPKDPPPATMITPELRRWMDRHERVVELL
ncbi:MAG: hypothetical protein K9G48_12660 [Reyranella sp.]|nr:hypothetical protein [Reyranella sp.]